MNEPQHLRDWLELERRGAPDDRVEAALTRVFASLPVLEPSTTFAESVALATRWAPLGARWFGRPAVRVAVALCVVQVALLLGLLPAVLSTVSSSVGLPGAVTTLVSTSVASLRWLGEAASVSSSLTETLAGFATHPVLLAVLGGCLVLSAVGLAVLVQLRHLLRLDPAGGEP